MDIFKSKHIGIILLSLLCSSYLFAQNLVPNGDFENYTILPTGDKPNWYRCVGWSNVNGNFGVWPYATPEYFHTSGTGGANIPNSNFGTISAKQGSAIMGLSCRHSNVSDARDYIATTLSSPLVIGQNYTISFWLSNSSGNHHYGNSCNHFGIQFTNSPMSQTDHESIGGIPQVEILSEVWTTTWQFFTFNYTATSAFPYITVGNFYNDAATSYSFQVAANFANAYYFIDDLQVVSGTLGSKLLNFNAEKNVDKVDLSWKVNMNEKRNFFNVERSTDLIKWEEIKSIHPDPEHITSQFEFIDENPFYGNSYYRLKYYNDNSKEDYSDIKKISFLSKDISVSPNPFVNEFQIHFPVLDEVYNLKIYDMLGKIIQSSSIQSNGINTIRTESKLPVGIYFIEIYDSNENKIHHQKLVKN